MLLNCRAPTMLPGQGTTTAELHRPSCCNDCRGMRSLCQLKMHRRCAQEQALGQPGVDTCNCNLVNSVLTCYMHKSTHFHGACTVVAVQCPLGLCSSIASDLAAVTIKPVIWADLCLLQSSCAEQAAPP